MRYSVRDHRAIVHVVNYVQRNDNAAWVSAVEAKVDARNTFHTFLAHAMCGVRVKIHHRTANRLSSDAYTCLLCIKEYDDVQAA